MRIPYHLLALTLLAAAVCGPSAAPAQDNEEETFVVIKSGRLITLAGPEQRRSEVVLVNGKVRLVGTELEYPRTAEVIDARGEVVMPGLILSKEGRLLHFKL